MRTEYIQKPKRPGCTPARPTDSGAAVTREECTPTHPPHWLQSAGPNSRDSRVGLLAACEPLKVAGKAINPCAAKRCALSHIIDVYLPSPQSLTSKTQNFFCKGLRKRALSANNEPRNDAVPHGQAVTADNAIHTRRMPGRLVAERGLRPGARC